MGVFEGGGGGGCRGPALEHWTFLRETNYLGSSALRTSSLALTNASIRSRTSKFGWETIRPIILRQQQFTVLPK